MQRTNKEPLSFRYQVPAQLRFSDVDQFGHVNNSVYFSLFDTSKTQYVRDIIGPHILEEMGIVVASVEAQFLAPVFYPDQIVIQTACTRLGTKSFSLCQRAVNSRTGEVKCICHTTMVAYDIHSCKSIPLPAFFKEKIRAHEDNDKL